MNVGDMAENLQIKLNNETYLRFGTEFMPDYLIIHGLAGWLSDILRARESLEENKFGQKYEFLIMAEIDFSDLEKAKMIKSQGKWKNWYRGDKKMNLSLVRQTMQETKEFLISRIQQ
ncbi:hypothetical protein SYJ56_18890 [Algoriphagus sp. D3-2-R+10]|uniref:hypothetical protein n=1 Tax=Algoriphagus aurantiacus TaxID=3103948 RepID=UPI002B3BB6CD|nr:hypothetical protein [Algoriphagus sp. D3-2-R+10]MEB2777388.1 hypothetical protein [Algoriphagus sp. D3-2-R+10]